MKDQLWYSTKLGQLVRSGVDLLVPPKFSEASLKFGAQKIKFWTTFCGISALDTTYLRNETLHRQTLSIYSVSPKS